MNHIDNLEQKYFEGLTSPQEEQELREYLASHEGHDELRAVMSFAVVGKALHQVRTQQPVRRQPEPPRRLNGVRRWFQAAAIVGVLFAGGYAFTHHHAANDVCVAYVCGVKVTDRTQVMQQMEEAMDNSQTEVSMENQMKNVFNSEE